MSRSFLLLTLLALSACRRTPPAPAATPDAAAPDAAIPAAPDAKRLRLAATMQAYNADWSPQSSLDSDGTIYVTSGGLGFIAKDGVVAPIQPIASYKMPAETVPLVGFEGPDHPDTHVVSDGKGTPRLLGDEMWSPVGARGGIVGLVYPKGMTWIDAPRDQAAKFAVKPAASLRFHRLGTARDGTIFASVSGQSKIAVWRPGVAVDAGTLVDVPAPATKNVRECQFAPAFDGSAYACCEDISFEERTPALLRWDGEHFVEVFAGEVKGCTPLPSIDREGNLYRVQSDRLDRCAPGAKPACEQIQIEVPEVRTPHYASGFEQVRDEKGMRWMELRVEEMPLPKRLPITAVYARAPDDVWAFAPEAIFHQRGRPEAATRLPTRTDARVLAMNEHAPSTNWTDCASVFVELGRGFQVDAGAHTDPAKIAEVLGKRGPPVEWRLVTGRLADREVAGVVVWRNEYNWEPVAMVIAVREFVDKFTRDPMNVPAVYCTLPVLSRVLDRPPTR